MQILRSAINIAILFLSIICRQGSCMSPTTISTSLGEFDQFIISGIPARAVTWEVFGTPEYTGGIPGPTDFVTLIAELTPADGWTYTATSKIAKGVTITPEADRTWLSHEFQTLMQKYKNQMTDIPARYSCLAYSAQIRSSGRKVRGFICPRTSKVLMYLLLREPE